MRFLAARVSVLIFLALLAYLGKLVPQVVQMVLQLP